MGVLYTFPFPRQNRSRRGALRGGGRPEQEIVFRLPSIPPPWPGGSFCRFQEPPGRRLAARSRVFAQVVLLQRFCAPLLCMLLLCVPSPVSWCSPRRPPLCIFGP